MDKNEPFYIGISSEEGYKYTRAYTKKARNNLWYKIVNKTSYQVDILIDNISIEEAYSKETEFINMYGRIDLGTGTLTNMTDGGESLVNLSTETRLMMGNNISLRQQKPILQYSLSGEFIKEWESAKKASEVLKIPASHITKVCKKKAYMAYGFIWMYKIGDYILQKITEIDHRKSRIITDYSSYRDPEINARRVASRDLVAMAEKIKIPIYQYNKSGDLIREWSSATDAGNFLGIKHISSISSCCTGNRNSAFGFVWRYKDPEKWFPPVYKERTVDYSIVSRKNRVAVMQYDLTGQFLKEWSSAIDASETLNIGRSGISNCCNTNCSTRTSAGYIWKYKRDQVV